MVLADSPPARIRCTRAVSEVSSTIGRPMFCPRSRRDSRTVRDLFGQAQTLLGVSRAAVHRMLAEEAGSSDISP